MNPTTPNQDLPLRQVALIAGLGYLIMPVPFAEFYAFPKLVIPGNIEQTTQNIAAHSGLFVAAIFCYFITFISDVVIAWALYYLLAPVHKALSLLASWFQLMYAAIAFFGLLNLVTVFRLLNTPDYLTLFGPGPLRAQVQLLLNSFQYDWSIGLVLFGIHLVLLGYLIYRSGYIPKIIGILLIINGFGWMIDRLRPYLYPNANLGFLAITFLGELVFMVWLLVRGRKIKEQTEAQ